MGREMFAISFWKLFFQICHFVQLEIFATSSLRTKLQPLVTALYLYLTCDHHGYPNTSTHSTYLGDVNYNKNVPANIVSAISLATFKARLNGYDLSKFAVLF